MKYLVFSLLALAACAGTGILLARAIGRKRGLRRGPRALLALGLTLALLLGVGLGYMGRYSRAEASAAAYLNSAGPVAVERIPEGWRFDGPGEGTAVIFYPGARVEAAAYAPLLFSLAERGIDGYLAEMPLRFAPLGRGAASVLMAQYESRRWLLMGHSLGGNVAAGLASAPEAGFDGVILLAAYPTKPVGGRLLSIYGSEDGVLSRESYEKGKAFWPEDAQEVVIDGGNHAQFGDYGPQSGDGEARISAEEQKNRKVEAILRWLGEP